MNSAKRKKLPPKMKDMSSDELHMFLSKRRESEAKALAVVHSLLDYDIVSETIFLHALPKITQSQYDDVTEERAIVKLCGYPLCSKKLPTDLPNQKYKISAKLNKVYDITERKKFCSNECYKASEFIKGQILTSPLWYREKEDNPEFKLLPLNCKGVPGQEIDLSLIGKLDIGERIIEGGFKSLLDFTEASLVEMSIENEKIELESVEVIESNQEMQSPASITTLVSPESVDNLNQLPHITNNTGTALNSETESTLTTDEKIKKKPTKSTGSSIVGDIIERKAENRVDPFISAGEFLQASQKTEELNAKIAEKRKIDYKHVKKTEKVKKKTIQSVPLAVIHVEKCLGEWFTLETLIFLFGENKVKQMVADKGDCIKEYLNNMACGLFYKSTSYDQYQQLCRKLNLLELEDRRYDSKVTNVKGTKPLPHYSMLKEENKMLDIKVRAFYKGNTEIPVQEQTHEIVKSLSSVEGEGEKLEKNTQEEALTNLPLVDKNAQNALRRKIVLTGLNKVLSDLSQALGISSREVSGEVRIIVATFNLQANNILFKPAQWSMVALIIIKLMSIRDIRLAQSLEKDMANRHLQLLLMSYEQDGGYLDRLVSWLTDIDRLLDNSNTQLTIGSC